MRTKRSGVKQSKMKKTLKITILLTIISFTIFTKWWYVLPLDGTDQIMNGFPLAYIYPCCNSLEFMVILSHLIIDVLVYFAFWFTIVFVVNKYLFEIKLSKFITIPLWIISILHLLFMSWIYYEIGHFQWVEDDFLKKKKIMETGYRFIWEEVERPDYYKYHPEKKK